MQIKKGHLYIVIVLFIAVGGVAIFLFKGAFTGKTVLEANEKYVSVGVTFPDFKVTEVDGRVITRNSLKGNPSIIWFTTSWCVPCQIGAKEVAKLDNQLRNDTFNVLVIFVDPRESDSDLINWRNKSANEDWDVAFDNFVSEAESLSVKVGLKYLDSKFLLDKNGVIKNIDFQIADAKYIDLIRKIVEEG